MPIITVFLGMMGSGKSHRARLLKEQDPNLVEVSFAEALKELVAKILGLPKEEVMKDAFKSAEYVDYEDVDYYGEVYKDHIITGRQILQRTGAALREIYEDFWVRLAAKKIRYLIERKKDIVITDCRFKNEVRGLLRLSKEFDFKEDMGYNDGVFFEFIFCDYKSDRYNDADPHESEHLAQELKRKGYKDGDKIDEKDLI